MLLIIGCSSLLYGNSPPPHCTEEDRETTKLLKDVYLFPQQNEVKAVKTDEIKYLFKHLIDDKLDYKPVSEVRKLSQQYIECHSDYYKNSPYVFDKPLPNGWLYPQFHNDDKWKKYFDTGQNEYWVFPNVHCDKNTRRLTAMSWMRSGMQGSHDQQKNMHKKFKKKNPSLSIVNTGDGSVYCSWNGWLYPAEDQRYDNWFDTEDDEAFTLINVYCRNNRVVYLHRAEHNGKSIFGDGIKDRANDRPFKKNDKPVDKSDNWVRCNWKGWLYKAKLLNDTWNDGNDGNEERWTYERYFIVSNNGIGQDKKKRGRNGDARGAIHGRVMNPYCSQATKEAKIGVVTAIRAYCFYPSSGKWFYEKRSMCDDLKSLD